jgi:hypothetical protein
MVQTFNMFSLEKNVIRITYNFKYLHLNLEASQANKLLINLKFIGCLSQLMHSQAGLM